MTNEELVEKIQSGEDVESNMGLLYQQNRWLIYKFALPYSDMADMDDLMQEAYFGLVKAVEKYDPEKEFKFITYAEWNIRGHLQRYCYNFGKNRRIPVHMIERMSKYHDVIRKYENEYGEKPSDEYIKKELQINTNQLKAIRKTILTCNTISFDDIVPGTDATFGETIADETDFQEEIVQKMAEEQVNSSVWKSVDELPSKMKDIIHLRYENGLSQKSVAENLGISAERIRQYEHRAYQLLKAKEAIQRAAEFYDCNHNSMLYHDTLSFYKNHGMSAIEYMVIKKKKLKKRKTRSTNYLMTWFGKCDFMSMKQKLKDISKTKLRVSVLQKEYNCYVAQAKRMKELGLSATSEKCSKGAEETYQEIQKELSEYKRIIAAVKSVEGLQGMILQLHYFEGKSIQHIAEMMNYSSDYLREIRNSAVKVVEKLYHIMEGVA